MDTILDFVITALMAHPQASAIIAIVVSVGSPLLYLLQPWLQKKVEESPNQVDNLVVEVFYKILNRLTPKATKRGAASAPPAAGAGMGNEAVLVVDKDSVDAALALLGEGGIDAFPLE